MDSMAPRLSCNAVDDSFGPAASACRFDFTLLFEDTILSIAPSALFWSLAARRLWQLRREQTKARRASLQIAKAVSAGGKPK